MLGSRRPAGWPQGLTLVAQAVLPTMGAMVLVPSIPLLQMEFGHRPHADFLLPAILTVPGLCIALLSVFAGLCGDRFGRRNILILSLGIYGFAGMAPIFLQGFWSIFLARVLLGICEAVIITLSATLVGDYFTGRTRERWLALISTVATLSVLLLLPLGGFLAHLFGWRGPFLIYGAALLLVPAMVLLTWEPEVAQGRETGRASSDFPWKHLIRTGSATFLGSTLFYTLAIQQAVGLSALGVVDPSALGALTMVASLGNPLGTLLFQSLSRFGLHRVLSVAFGLLTVSFVLIPACRTGGMFSAAAFIGLLGAGLLMPTLITWTMSGMDGPVRGRGTGVFQSLFALGQFASGLVLPALTHLTGGAVLMAFGCMGLLSGAAFIVAVGFALRPGQATALTIRNG